MAEVEIGIGKTGRRAYGFDDIAIVPSRRTRDPDDIDILARITSDRSDAMKRLRDESSIRPGTTIESDEARREALFALTNDFARLIYLLGQVAHFLTEVGR